MSKRLWAIAFAVTFALTAGAVPHVIRFTEPAEENARGWEERSLPLGNGWFGINLFGGIGEELVTVTHNAVLTGREFAGKVYGNLMVDVQATNEKLKARAVRIVMTATGCDETQAKDALAEAGGKAKTAILMIIAGLTADEASARLDEVSGVLSAAIKRSME